MALAATSLLGAVEFTPSTALGTPPLSAVIAAGAPAHAPPALARPAAARLVAGALAAGGSGGGARAARPADGLRHTTVEVASAGCGHGWTHPEPGRQVFDLRNSSGTAAEVYLTDPRTGAVYGEVEGLAPGTSARYG